MIKLVFCLRRLPGLSRHEFLRYWLEEHGPLVRSHAEALHIRRYEQAHSVESAAGDALAAVRGAPSPFDGVASLWFDSMADMRAAGATPSGRHAARELLEDERRFIDLPRSPLWFTEEHRIV
ncbi:EthD domain-containing protein [Amycolatopsis sp. K13G38]|uniref:EthD domain-containing protein n=1 Tax=Amycolatopsis acididurans TaxID=2724524 RepID=A0ABX1J087_9PSEU|nr:EthD domain-containing protein [Amycolatopsis acididurans]NKQ53187.1 EthD domain-containing protein [Amycolatopsis acididurans]